MGLFDSFKAGLDELFNSPTDFVKDSTPFTQGNYVPDSNFGGSDFGTPNNQDISGSNPHVAKNGAFTAGLSLLFSDPAAFFGSIPGVGPYLSSKNVNNIPASEIDKAANQPPELPGIPDWIKIAAIGGVIIVGAVAVGYAVRSFK